MGSEECNKAYAEHRAKVAALGYATTSDYLKATILKFSTRKNADEKLVAVPGTHQREFALTPNDYPYVLQEGLKHSVFWAPSAWDLDKVRAHVREIEGECDLVVWVNPLERQSIPGLWH